MTKQNPFNKNITLDYFKQILSLNFDVGVLDNYSHLTGDICYKLYTTCSIGWDITCYITENGISLEHDYECGGNSSHVTWWFEDITYTINEFNYSTYNYEDVEYVRYGVGFETAWSEMLNKLNELKYPKI